jgi:pimeloyl-ACP methyl ester carboxylesterase
MEKTGSVAPNLAYRLPPVAPAKRIVKFSKLDFPIEKVLSFIQKVAKQIKAIALDIFAVIPIAGVALFSLKNPRKKDIDRNQPPILMVHGFLGMSSNWIFHRHRLNKGGVKNIFTIGLGSPFKSIEAYAEIVAKKIHEIKQLTGRDDVILVGHSMGGLVIDAYKKLYANKNPEDKIRILDTITVGTPITGTWIAVIASLFSKCARQMVPSSAFSRQRKMQWKERRQDGTKVKTESFKHGSVRIWKQVITYTDRSEMQRLRRIEANGDVYEYESRKKADGTIIIGRVIELPKTYQGEALHIASEYDTIVPFNSAADTTKDRAEGVESIAITAGKGGHVWQMVSRDISGALFDRIRSTIELNRKTSKNVYE